MEAIKSVEPVKRRMPNPCCAAIFAKSYIWRGRRRGIYSYELNNPPPNNMSTAKDNVALYDAYTSMPSTPTLSAGSSGG